MNKIYVDDVGNGFPLVLVHGYLGSSEMWCLQKDYFSKFCRVITPAIPGFGESSDIKSLDTIEGMASKIIESVYSVETFSSSIYFVYILLQLVYIYNIRS